MSAWDIAGFYACVLCAGALITIASRLRARGSVGDWWHCTCESCHAPLPFWHANLPVVSHLYLKGRSACCGQRLSWSHPLLELALGAALFAAWRAWLAWIAP